MVVSLRTSKSLAPLPLIKQWLVLWLFSQNFSKFRGPMMVSTGNIIPIFAQFVNGAKSVIEGQLLEHSIVFVRIWKTVVFAKESREHTEFQNLS